MDAPVFVIHGVANRDKQGFTAAVSALEAACGMPMVPVYWGDLGAEDQFIAAALPHAASSADVLRDDGEPVEPTPDSTLLASVFPMPPSCAEPWGLMEAMVRDRLATGSDDGSDGLRDHSSDRLDPDEVIECLAEEWPETQWLSRTDDTALLREASRSLADALLDAAAADDPYHGLRGAWGPREGRIRTLVRRHLRDLDRLTGVAVQAVAGRMNHVLRSRFGPGTTRFLGDVLVYQRHQQAIHARIRRTIADVHPDLGRHPGMPVRVVAHSLGGVIAVDMATATEPLWTDRLVTFGSQAAFFHVCDPRGGQLSPYGGDARVVLPASLARWTNLWEPLDMLAFAASKVFQLHDGTAPSDIPVTHRASTGLWTHSAYWDLPDVANAIAEAMSGAAQARPAAYQADAV